MSTMLYSPIHVSALIEAVGRTGGDAIGRLAAATSWVDAAGYCVRSLDAAEYEDFLQLCLIEFNDAGLGLAMAEQASLPSLGLTEGVPGGRLASLRVAIETFSARFAASVDAEPTLSVASEEAVLGFPAYGTTDASRRLHAEYAVALGVLLIRAWAGPFATPLWVSFPHEAPSYVGEYQRLFGGLVRFRAQRAAIGMNTELLSAKAYPWGHQLFGPSSRFASAATHACIPERVRKFLASCTERPDMAEIASQLGIRERTLRRRLAAHGVCFRELWDDARRTRAMSVALDRTSSPAAAAETLGFSRVSALSRAFERWTGLTLSEYRAIHLGEEQFSRTTASAAVAR